MGRDRTAAGPSKTFEIKASSVGSLFHFECHLLAKADTAFQGASVGQPTEPCLGEHRALWLCLALIHAAMLDTVALAAGQQQCESQHC